MTDKQLSRHFGMMLAEEIRKMDISPEEHSAIAYKHTKDISDTPITLRHSFDHSIAAGAHDKASEAHKAVGHDDAAEKHRQYSAYHTKEARRLGSLDEGLACER